MYCNQYKYVLGLHDCMHMSKSRRFQPDRVQQQQTRLGIMWTDVKECRKRVVCETREGHTSFVSYLIFISIGLLFVKI